MFNINQNKTLQINVWRII